MIERKVITKEIKYLIKKENENAKTSSKLSEEFSRHSDTEVQKIKIERDCSIIYYSFLNISKKSRENIITKQN